MPVKISKNFYLHEFTRSEAAARMGREVVVPSDVMPAITALCDNVLEPLRTDIRKSITVLSGYRPKWLNDAIGGSGKSQHMVGEAADIIAASFSPMALCQRIVALNLPFDQLILEFNQWTHVSHALGRRGKREVITAKKSGDKTVYLRGLVP